MTTAIKLTGSLYRRIIQDLIRPHFFAGERIGFAFGRLGSLANGGKLILLNRYHSIPDEQYVEDPGVGARIGSEALIWAMQAVYQGRPVHEGIFHIHLHKHKGETEMSRVDSQEIPRLMPGFQSVGSQAAHGIIVLSLNHATGWIWLPTSKEPVSAADISIIGVPVCVFERRITN